MRSGCNQNRSEYFYQRRTDPRILIVEDDDVALKSLLRIAGSLNISSSISCAQSGEEAIQQLREWSDHTSQTSPIVILLDLNLPGMSGLDVLAVLDDNEGLPAAKTFVYSSNRCEEDICKAYGHGVSGYIVKSRDSANDHQVLLMLEAYIRSVVLPQ